MLEQAVVRLNTPDHLVTVGLVPSCLALDHRNRWAACRGKLSNFIFLCPILYNELTCEHHRSGHVPVEEVAGAAVILPVVPDPHLGDAQLVSVPHLHRIRIIAKLAP